MVYIEKTAVKISLLFVDSSIFVDIRNINEIQDKILYKVVFQPDFECMKEIFERVVENRPLPAEIDIHIE